MKNSSVRTRVISGLIIAAVLAVVGLIGGIILYITCLIVSLIALSEIYRALGLFDKDAEDRKNNILAIAGFIGTVIYYIAIGSGIISFCISSTVEISDRIIHLNDIACISITVVAMLVIFMAIYVISFPRFTFESVAYAFTGFIYITIFLSSVYLIRNLSNGRFVFWLIFISAWICDTCAYFVGSNLGKRKLAPVLSPKKSVEGSIGGIIGSVIVGFLLGYVVEYKLCGGANHTIAYMIICAIGAVVAQIGDLVASGIKRNHDIKDYGNLIPGHGGMLDRFDSVIFVAPVIYILSVLFL